MTDPIFVLFTSTKSNPGKERWCPDTVEAHEVLDDLFLKAPASTYIIEVELSREEWKESPGMDHWLRKEPYNISSIPTLVEWDNKNDRPTKTVLIGAECSQMERISSLLMEPTQS